VIAALLPLVLAAELLPGRALTVPPCVPQPEAACWSEAVHLRRFVAPRGLLTEPVEADVLLAHQGDALLVRADALPADTVVEVVLTDGYAQIPSGIHAVPLSEPARLRQAQVRLLSADGPRPWSPSGQPYADETFPLLLADAPALGLPIALVSLDDTLVLQAPGADQLIVTREQAALPQRRRGVPEPWQAVGRDQIRTPRPPEAGWYRIEAVWSGMDVAARRVYLPAPSPPPVSVLGIHPAPALAEPLGGPGFALGPRSAIVLTEPSWQPAAALLSEELGRLLGRPLPVVSRRPRKGDIVLGGPDRIQTPAAAALAGEDEGFALELGARATVAASSLRGATYGVLALADALVTQPADAWAIADAPQIDARILYQELKLGRQPMDLDAWRAYVRRVVARGRYNTLYIGVRNSVQIPGFAELSAPQAMAPDELQAMIEAARALGIGVYPAFRPSGHASWLTAAHPERRSSGDPQALCLRDPETAALLEATYVAVWELFGEPDKVHIGHDEFRWPSSTSFGDHRDPHCAGVPPSVLLAESLRWHIDLFRKRGADDVLVWSDMLVEGWNGAQTHSALAALTPGEVSFAAWSKVGDSEGTLTEAGFPVVRLHTGYYEWKRTDLSPTAAGEGLALFSPFPWLVAADTPAGRGLAVHWSRVLLAGATAWQPALAEVPLSVLLDETAALSAYQPTLQGGGPLRAYSTSGTPAPGTWPAASAPPFARLDPVRASVDEPVVISVGDTVAVLSLLQAVQTSLSARQGLQVRTRSLGTAPPVAVVRFRYRDGSTAEVGLRYGIEVFELDSGSAAASLWGTAGSVSLGEDRRGWRVDVANPHPRREVDAVEVCPATEGAYALVFGAAGR